MKLKRILTLSLALCLVFSLAACGQKNPDKEDPDGTGGNLEIPAWQAFDTSVTTPQTTLTAQCGATVTIAPVVYDELDAGFEVTLENKTSENLYLQLELAAVNDVMAPTYDAIVAAPGKKDSTTQWFTLDTMRLSGIFAIHTVDLVIGLYDEDWDKLETLFCTIVAEGEDGKFRNNSFATIVKDAMAMEELGLLLVGITEAEQQLSDGVYLTAKSVIQGMYDQTVSYIYLELENRTDDVQYADVVLTKINGLEYFWDWNDQYILPQSKAMFVFEMGGSYTGGPMMEAFGIWELSELEMEIELAKVNEGYEIESGHGEETTVTVTYSVPDTINELDMSGESLYDDGKVCITAKEPVTGDYDETYIYLIFEVLDDNDVFVSDHPEKEIEVLGDSEYQYFDIPGWVEAGNTSVAYIEVSYIDAATVTVPVRITNGGTDEVTDLDLTFELG